MYNVQMTNIIVDKKDQQCRYFKYNNKLPKYVVNLKHWGEMEVIK